MIDLDPSTLETAPVDELEFAQWLARKLGRAPTTQELLSVHKRAVLARDQKREPEREPRRKRKSTKHITTEIMTDPMMALAGQIALGVVNLLTKQKTGTIEGENDPWVYLRHLRRNEKETRYGDTLYPGAIGHLCHTYGRPIRLFDGFSAWEIVERARPEIGHLLRRCRGDDWMELHSRKDRIANTSPTQLLALFPHLAHQQPIAATPQPPAPKTKRRKSGQGGFNA